MSESERNSGSGRRWWKWRRSRSSRRSEVDPPEVSTSWFHSLDAVCTQLMTVLPTISSSTKTAIYLFIGLLVVWRMTLWVLEFIVTILCLAAVPLIATCFLKPELAVWLLTEIVLPNLDAAREWLSRTFLSVGLLLTRRYPPPRSIPAIEYPTIPPPALASASATSVSSPRKSVLSLPTYSSQSEPALIKASA
ncbi:uncharacterized protein LOC128983534 [Macrosteles quadrilineatus]|uniref:uncharacterized protein LOC128983534 n=1 Tax=Macrosteles quadrilineatus TaxID=74068 RepID=UPI0023E26ECC|nr:uncharacterized protein LOC128983534 [Macrosteles quadrilineatus]